MSEVSSDLGKLRKNTRDVAFCSYKKDVQLIQMNMISQKNDSEGFGICRCLSCVELGSRDEAQDFQRQSQTPIRKLLVLCFSGYSKD